MGNISACVWMYWANSSSERVARGIAMQPQRITLASVILCGCMAIPRATRSDEEFAQYIHTQAEMFPIPGVYELRTTAAGGHVTIGGRVDSPVTLKELVRAVANTPGLTELSFFGVEFAPPNISDDEIVACARKAAADAVGQ